MTQTSEEKKVAEWQRNVNRASAKVRRLRERTVKAEEELSFAASCLRVAIEELEMMMR